MRGSLVHRIIEEISQVRGDNLVIESNLGLDPVRLQMFHTKPRHADVETQTAAHAAPEKM